MAEATPFGKGQFLRRDSAKSHQLPIPLVAGRLSVSGLRGDLGREPQRPLCLVSSLPCLSSHSLTILRSSPKSTTCTQIHVSGSALRETQTKTGVVGAAHLFPKPNLVAVCKIGWRAERLPTWTRGKMTSVIHVRGIKLRGCLREIRSVKVKLAQ